MWHWTTFATEATCKIEEKPFQGIKSHWVQQFLLPTWDENHSLPTKSQILSIQFSENSYFLFRFVIGVFPTVAEGTVILTAVKPDSQDIQSNQGDSSLRNSNVRQLWETELEEQEKHILSAGLYMSAG